jgi:AcrR family transcriptional regulator
MRENTTGMADGTEVADTTAAVGTTASLEDRADATDTAGATASLEDMADASGFSPFTAALAEERYAHFRAIEADRQQRILQAALEEFAERNYASASTNAIVKRANISKGLLFHYFGDKAGLYRYLFNHTIALLVVEALAFRLPADGDVFETMKVLIRVKLETTARYLTESNFLLRAMRDVLPSELDDLVKLSIERAYDWQGVIIGLLDGGLLRPGVDYEQATQLIQWVCEGLANECLETAPESIDLDYWERTIGRIDSYLDFLRDLLCGLPPRSDGCGCDPPPDSGDLPPHSTGPAQASSGTPSSDIGKGERHEHEHERA